MIWKTAISLDVVNEFSKNTLVDHLDIKFIEVGDDYIKASMPVDHRTVQPFRLLHGGASAALAETIGSTAASYCIEDLSKYMPVGIEINSSHVRGAPEGSMVYATAKPARLGRMIQVWNIDILNSEGKLVCVSRLTIAVVERRK